MMPLPALADTAGMTRAGLAMPEKIFVVRHGQSTWNSTRRVTGQLDPPLSAEGEAQAERLKKVLSGARLTAIYTSDLSRAVATARPTAQAQGLPIQQRAALREQHLGVVQGRFRDERDAEARALWSERDARRLNFRIPGGETHAELEARVVACLNEISHKEPGGCVLIVGHRNTNRVLLAALLDWPADVAVQAKLRSHHLYEIAPLRLPLVQTISLREGETGSRREGFWQ